MAGAGMRFGVGSHPHNVQLKAPLHSASFLLSLLLTLGMNFGSRIYCDEYYSLAVDLFSTFYVSTLFVTATTPTPTLSVKSQMAFPPGIRVFARILY